MNIDKMLMIQYLNSPFENEVIPYTKEETMV